MKVIVGIDSSRRYEAALALLSRLEFPEIQLHLVHVIQPEDDDLIAPILPTDENLAHRRSECSGADFVLETASCKAVRIDPHPKLEALHGSAAEQLMRYADRQDASLICVSAKTQGAFKCFALGSVCRALTIGAHQSILIAKGTPEAEGPLKAVFATDHSRYANKCVRHLLALRPKGLSDVTVLSVIRPYNFYPISPEAAQANFEEDQRYCSDITQKTEAVCDLFKAFGTTAVAGTGFGDPKTEIGQIMKATGSDLAILGAQGHGFFERLAIGSVALQQVVNEDYPVLVVRSQ